MTATSSKYFSVKLTRFLLRVIGFWSISTRKEQLSLRLNYAKMFIAVGICFSLALSDLYYCQRNFYRFRVVDRHLRVSSLKFFDTFDCSGNKFQREVNCNFVPQNEILRSIILLEDATYFACCTIPPFVIILKAITFTLRRKELLWLIEQSQNHFWYKEYDVFEKKIMDSLDKRASLLMCSYIVLNFGVAIMYVIIAVIGTLLQCQESIGNPKEERVHPFTWRFFNLPSTRTPYYEILFLAETIIIMHTATCYCCFDNVLYMLCMLISEQFKILQNKFGTIFDPFGRKPVRSYRVFKSCIVFHHFLISYVQKLECVFCFPLMCQLLISSIVLCVSAFQLTTSELFLRLRGSRQTYWEFFDISPSFSIQKDNGIFVKKFMFVIYVLGGLMQIFLITLYCDNITEQSDAVGKAMYSCNWEGTSRSEFQRLRKDIIIVMLRCRRPCHMTAAKFFPISIESFTKVISTTVSYLTLLRTMDD
ncbi:uncharacterized protein LOC143428191 [Xylocopa sonorina]|uniref:uncharacterized protein LOC143428191 n=1 Tax=Xylocopa sonorina TaxID=1818115 RepID=UPI00403ACFB2